MRERNRSSMISQSDRLVRPLGSPAVTELTLHGARPAGVPRPRLGYAMVTAASALFAVNGTVSKVIAHRGRDHRHLRLTELRATGAFAGLAAFALLAAPRRLRVARDELPLLVVLRDRRLRARAVALLRRHRASPDRDRPPARVHGSCPRRALGAVRLARARATARLGGARARALGPRSRGAGLARRPPRHDRRGRRASRRGSTRDVLPRGRAASRRAATRSRSSCLRSASRRSSGRSLQPWWSFPFDALGESVSLGGALASVHRPRLGPLPVDDRPRHDRCRSSLSLGALHHLASDDGGHRRDVRGAARRARRLGVARGDAVGRPARRRRGRACRRSSSPRHRADDAGSTLVAWSTRVLLASPRGYCAGVERAVETVERALEHYGAPVYVRKQIVHNIHVVRDLEARGAIFVEEETEVPRGATVVYSAHGVAPTVHRERRASSAHDVIDATCPLVTKVHVQARALRRGRLHGPPHRPRGSRGGRGHDGRGARRDDSRAGRRARRRRSTCPPTRPSPTSRRRPCRSTRRPRSSGRSADASRPSCGPKKEDICYATSNRQWAVKDMLAEIDLLLVIGSRNSSNSNRLVDVARAVGVAGAPDRRRGRDRQRLARRRRHGRDHLGRLRAGAARHPRLRLVPRPRRRADRVVPDGGRGRDVPAPRRAAPRARSSRSPGPADSGSGSGPGDRGRVARRLDATWRASLP